MGLARFSLFGLPFFLTHQQICLQSKSLNLNRIDYPQYIPTTVTPFIETKKNLLLTGQYMGALPLNKVDTFKFTARVDFQTNEVDFVNSYPKDLYGNNYNWEGEIFTTVFSTIHPDGDKLVCSFPVSHNLQIINLNNKKTQEVYAGSNEVGNISSIEKSVRNVSREELVDQIVKQDEYAAILYDKYRKVYYRFLLKGLSSDDKKKSFKDKSIAVILMDKNFNYLGETTLGQWKFWNWRNSFVTKEGLNIEYLDGNLDESGLTLKILNIKKKHS
ncbi:DUF4221 family protein [Flavobacterium sp. KACC 22761]|uniref:DUF4221 family protein n=1 Tax=Flavobacterium sp. KACC 22761 TaxID=3092665 RepID=UPI002A75E8AD|nr:DUF4221 family protein [Flavobacterium sp. KACC 22761]WPO77896.1 DUF4221 family protein [Flavobacterium sp. KACC 22761]